MQQAFGHVLGECHGTVARDAFDQAGLQIRHVAVLRGPQDQPQPQRDHRQRQDLAHGQADRRRKLQRVADGVAGTCELRVGLAHELHGEARQPVDHEEHAGERAGPLQPAATPGEPEEDRAHQRPSSSGLVELRGVARADRRQAVERHAQRSRAGLRGLTGKDHAPGHVGGTAPELGIDEIRDPAQPDADGHHHRHGVGDLKRRRTDAAAEDPRGDGHADQPAVEGHAALPDAQDRQGVGEVSARLVEQRVSHPPADDDAEDDGSQEPLHLRGRMGGVFAGQSSGRRIARTMSHQPASRPTI
jgi:hypothetical protein